MRRAAVALIVGLALGYSIGYRDANAGKPTIAKQTLERFGASKVRAAQRAQEERVQEASRP